jgi:hypothetical protein
MQALLQIAKVEDVCEWLEKSSQQYTATQSIPWLIDQVGQLCNEMAFVNNQMAVARKELNSAKVRSYGSLIVSSYANNHYFAPSLAKDYIAAKCGVAQYNYDVCERASRTITHTLEALRTCISALKMELSVQHYQGQV